MDMKPNIERLDKILDAVHLNPKRYNQRDLASSGECGAAFCIAGWAVLHKYETSPEQYDVITGANYYNSSGALYKLTKNRSIWEEACDWLGIDVDIPEEWPHLFESNNSLPLIIERRNKWAAEQGLSTYTPPQKTI